MNSINDVEVGIVQISELNQKSGDLEGNVTELQMKLMHFEEE